MTLISVVASGTRGDVQPYLALARGLKGAGFDVRVLTSDNFESLVTDAGLDFVSMGESVEALLESPEWQKTLDNGNFLTILSKMQSEMKRRAAGLARKMPPLLEGSDVIVTGMAGMGGTFTIAQKLGIPVVQAYVLPFTPTREFPGPLAPKLPLGGAVNRLSFHVVRQMMWQSTRAGDVATREALGLAKAPFFGPFKTLDQQRGPVLYGYSRHVLPQPADWSANHHVTGYWFLDEPHGWTPPDDLLAFLDAGDPPVYIGFGSMRSGNAEQAGQVALDALAKSGQRGVIASGWGGLKAANVPSSVHLIHAIPHSWLFPRMAAVVHHGGAGTTAAGLRAGVPSILVPFMGDQPFWGQRVFDLGVGPAPIRRKKLTADNLAAAIQRAVTDSTMRSRAAELGARIRSEDGMAAAVSLIQRWKA